MIIYIFRVPFYDDRSWYRVDDLVFDFGKCGIFKVYVIFSNMAVN